MRARFRQSKREREKEGRSHIHEIEWKKPQCELTDLSANLKSKVTAPFKVKMAGKVKDSIKTYMCVCRFFAREGGEFSLW